MAKDKYVHLFIYFEYPYLNLCTLFIVDRFTKGIYAISVSGRLPNGIIREMKNRGIPYRPRDTSQR